MNVIIKECRRSQMKKGIMKTEMMKLSFNVTNNHHKRSKAYFIWKYVSVKSQNLKYQDYNHKPVLSD